MVIKSLGESDDFFFILSGILFLVINFEPKVSQLYFAMCMIGAWAYTEINRKKLFTIPPLKRPTVKWSSAVLYGMAGFAVFIFITPIILSSIFGLTQYSSPQSVIELMASGFSTKPVLEASPYVSFIVWGQLIPYIETIFFPVMMALWISHKYSLSITTLKGKVVVMFIIGLIAALFHITAKASYAGIPDNAAVITTFIFFFINTFLVLHFHQKIEAAIMHITGNTIAINEILKLFHNPLFTATN